MSLKDVAQETLKIIQQGEYTSDSGRVVVFRAEQRHAQDGTKLYRPDDVETLLPSPVSRLINDTRCVIEVTDETTQIAAHRLVTTEARNDLVVLNFASARNPCGGFLTGAKSQEEDLARCSGLYPCQLTQPVYYEVNRSTESLLYTDHMIYSPNVPWFRTTSRNLLDDFFLASVITAPAPNAGADKCRDDGASEAIDDALTRRAGYVLAVARANGHRSLLLGAWGCGVFRNDPCRVADTFGSWLESPEFDGCFDRVIFAVYDKTKRRETLSAFQARFGM